MDFDGQRPDEEVHFIFRRHAVTAWRTLVFCLAMILIGFIPVILWPDNPRMVFLWMLFVVLGIVGILYGYILWYFSLYVVTNQRIRQIRQKGFFSKTVVDLDLKKIKNMSLGSHGIVANIFNYGTILIQTAAGDLVISHIRYPEKVYNELQNALHNFESGDK